MNDNWMDNVGPLLTALENLDIDPVEWAKDPDMEVFWGESDSDVQGQRRIPVRMWLPKQEPDLIHFACGYLQATGNLTGLSWAEQIQQQLDKENA